MPYYTRAELVAQLTPIETAITAALTSQSYDAGDRSLKRANLKDLYAARREIIDQIEAIDRGTTGSFNKVKFARPL